MNRYSILVIAVITAFISNFFSVSHANSPQTATKNPAKTATKVTHSKRPTVSLDKIVAIVNDGIVTESELRHQMRAVNAQLAQNNQPAPDQKALQKQVLEQLITREVQMQIASRAGIIIDDVALDETLAQMAKSNNLSIDGLREAIQAEGLDYQNFREHIRKEKSIQQLQQHDLYPDINVTDQEITQFMQSPTGLAPMLTEYRLSHILISLPEAPTTEQIHNAEQKAQSIVKRLRKGEDFAKIAMQESKGALAINGGDLGYKKLPQMPTIFVKSVPHLKVNEVTTPIRSTSGFHIIKLTDKRRSDLGETKIQKTLVRHILIKTNEFISEQEAKKRLAEITQKLKSGTEFGKLAKIYSDDLGSKTKGGELGWVTDEVLVPEFSAMMNSLQPKQISEPFASPFGWHIAEVLDRKIENDAEDMWRKRAKEMISQRKFEEKLETWQRQLRDEAFVKILIDQV